MDNLQIKDSYKSIASEARGLFKDNGSRFIAHAYPVETEEEVKEIVAALKKEYYDARHHVYAYRLGHLGDKFRANDDGEPSGSSGRPVLGQIDSNELSDILVVVVRYFGGIKLGIPGLIRAYKTSTADALANAEIVEKIASKHYRIHFGYLNMNDVMKVMKDMGLEQKNQKFDMECSIDTSVRLSLVDTFLERMGDVEGCRIDEILIPVQVGNDIKDRKMSKKSLISIGDFTKEEILHVLETAKEFEQNRVQNFLEGKVIASLFFEPSTRTRLSFETAINRLGAKVIGFSDASNTSQSKGETLKDTIKMVSNYVDMIVMRHPLEGSSRYASEEASVPVINAGDGANQHPSQTLLDLYSILQTQGTLEGLTINMVGDLKYGRTTHSLLQAMSHFNPKFIFTAPEEL